MQISHSWKYAAAGLAAAMLISGCGGGSAETPPASSAAAPETSAAAPETSAAAPAPAGDFDPEMGFVAIAKAEADTVPGSTAIGLDLEDDLTWKVELIEGAVEHDLVISSDGMTVLSHDQDDADSEDVTRAGQAKLSLSVALRRAMNAAPGSTIDDIELTTENDVLVWKAEFDDPEVTVLIDATTGETIA